MAQPSRGPGGLARTGEGDNRPRGSIATFKDDVRWTEDVANFRAAEHAVSPLIATILLVAITVTMAGAVLFLFTQLGEPTESRPNAAFQDEQVASRLVVISAPQDLDWEHIVVHHERCGLPLLNGADALLTGTRVTGSRDVVIAGDYIEVFPAGTCEIRLIHLESNSQLGTWRFR